MIGADRGTHCKIVAVALSTGVTLALAGMAASRTSDTALVHAKVEGTFRPTVTPAMSASIAAPVLR
jgi:hypothetical protein